MKVFDIVTDKNFLRKKCEEVSLPLSDEDREILLEMVDYVKYSQDEELANKLIKHKTPRVELFTEDELKHINAFVSACRTYGLDTLFSSSQIFSKPLGVPL